ncbi:MAG: SAM-dependent chlorinase/fluorinase [Chloroflexi bacterium]|nr:SAM-dependent chlorinase/fluorinase [Chloroflexota bacterium]
MPPKVITLTTDFGLRDPYVGQMKGVILSINPEAVIVDLCHDIPSQDVQEGAFVLGTSFRHFPPGTIHVAVVDPGVGTSRRAMAVEAAGMAFLAPDNGLLSWVLAQEATWRAVSLSNPKYWRPTVSRTFHGRDIFAPVAAYLSLGVSMDDLGEPVADPVLLPMPTAARTEEGGLIGHVIHVDRFGNIITDIAAEDLPEGALTIEVAGQLIEGLAGSYAEATGLLALIGSSDHLEIAWSEGSAAARLGIGRGAKVIVRPANIRSS